MNSSSPDFDRRVRPTRWYLVQSTSPASSTASPSPSARSRDFDITRLSGSHRLAVEFDHAANRPRWIARGRCFRSCWGGGQRACSMWVVDGDVAVQSPARWGSRTSLGIDGVDMTRAHL